MHTEGQLNFYHLGYYHLDCHLDQKASRNTRFEQNFNIDGPKKTKQKRMTLTKTFEQVIDL